METICLDTTHEESDSTILTLKRKLSDPHVDYIESGDSKTQLPSKNNRIKPNDSTRPTTSRVTRSSTRSKTNIEPKSDVCYIDSDDSETESLPKRKRIQRNATATTTTRSSTRLQTAKIKIKANTNNIKTVEIKKAIPRTYGSKKTVKTTAKEVAAEPKKAIETAAVSKECTETPAELRKTIEFTSEPKEAIDVSTEPKKAIDTTAELKKKIGATAEPEEAIEFTLELKKAIEISTEPTKAIDATTEAIEATIEPKMAIDASIGLKNVMEAITELNNAREAAAEPMKAIIATTELKKVIEVTIEPKMAIETTIELKKAIEATTEPTKAIEATTETMNAIGATAELKKALESTPEPKKIIDATAELKKVIEVRNEPKKAITDIKLQLTKALTKTEVVPKIQQGITKTHQALTSAVYYIDSDSEIEPSPKRIQRNATVTSTLTRLQPTQSEPKVKLPNYYKTVESKKAIEVSVELKKAEPKAMEATAESRKRERNDIKLQLTKALVKPDTVPKIQQSTTNTHQTLTSDIYYIDSDSEIDSPPKKRKIQRNATATNTSRLQTSKTKVKPKAKQPSNINIVGPKKTIEIITEPKHAQINYINLQPTTAHVDFAPKIQITETYFNRNERYEHLLLAEKANLDIHTVKHIVQMFEAGNTIPFIARYRKHLTNDMSPEKLREVKEAYEGICSLKARTDTVLKTLERTGMLTDDLRNCIYNCRNLSELEHIYDPFKCGNKKTLAVRAKSLGLETAALALLTGARDVDPKWFINKNTDGLRTVEEVERGIMHIIALVISTDTEIIKFVRALRQQSHLTIETKKSTAVAKDVSEADANKFLDYFNHHIPVNHIKPHQVLAINRGENLKVLSVKLNIPDYAFKKFKYFCEHRWLDDTIKTSTRIRVFQESIKDCYKRLISPLIIRQTRSSLKATAEKASIDVFTMNLKQLLLGTPLKGQPIMGIDPGFQHGCKVAIISTLGNVLITGVIYPLSKSVEAKELVKKFLVQHDCSLIALGNGTACRQTESWLSDLIQTKYFAPIDVQYTIIDECGASIYSCSPEAKKEFPDLDPLLVSAVSLARRVQDPLAELVKVEPKHLGVGMYQHDINKKALETALDEVVTECVSFVGVDLNTASHCILRKVAGLSPQRADNILAYRATKGPFTNRNQLMDVKGIGDKIFEQCAGFLRVGPSNSLDAKQFYSRTDTMPLDCTWIHPESYNLAEKIIEKFNLNYIQIGEPGFIKQFQESMKMNSIADLAKEFSSTEATIKLIIDVLSRRLDHDLRQDTLKQPLFKKGITSMNDITPDMVLTGRVTNVVQFGAFVDIGIGTNGLIHTSAMKGFTILSQDRVEVKILNINLELQRIGLEMVKKL